MKDRGKQMKKPKLTYANLTSTLALFIALTGATAYAAQKLPDNSVGEHQLRPAAITAEKIRKNAITSPKIKEGAVKQGKIANGSITAAKLTGGSVGNLNLQEGAVTNPKIATETITGDKILENTLSQVPSAARADTAAFADSANPEAFAAITPEAFVDQSLSKSIAQVKDGSLGGIYCVTAAGFAPKGAQVTARFNGEGDLSAYVRIGGTVDCPAPAVEVQTFDGGVRTREGFYVVLYR
jgi:hypothetical protein